MKKRVLVILSAVLILLSLAACGKTEATPAAPKPAEPLVTVPAQTPSPTPAPEATPEPEPTPAAEPESPAPAFVDPELKEFLDRYETFIDSYIDFMQEYKKSPTDLNLMMKYTSILQEYMEFAEAVEAYDSEDMSEADALYYAEVTLRCSQKMLAVIG